MSGGQKAGKKSTQVKAGRDVNFIEQNGVVVNLREVVQAEIELALSNYQKEALAAQVEKGNKMLDGLLKALGNNPANLSAFSEPDFNFSVRDAARAVASNDSEYTEELLVDILANRAVSGKSSKVRIVTKKGIEAADKLTADSLNGLAAAWALCFLVNQAQGFGTRFEKQRTSFQEVLMKFKPGKEGEWVDEAELLGLATVSNGLGSSKKSFAEFLSEKFDKYVRPGIPNARWEQAKVTLKAHKCEQALRVIEHPLKEGFMLLDYDTMDELDEATSKASDDNQEVKELIKELATTNGFDSADATAQQSLEALAEKDATYKKVKEVWDGYPGFGFTLVGKTIGYLHVRRHIRFTGAESLEDYINMKGNRSS